jgi:hypothetical protein
VSEYEHGRPKSQRGVCGMHVFDVGYLPRANFHASAAASEQKTFGLPAPGKDGFLRPLLVLPALVEGSGWSPRVRAAPLRTDDGVPRITLTILAAVKRECRSAVYPSGQAGAHMQGEA